MLLWLLAIKNNKMVELQKRSARGRSVGYFAALVNHGSEFEVLDEEETLVVDGENLQSDVYKVERIVEKRKIKVSPPTLSHYQTMV